MAGSQRSTKGKAPPTPESGSPLQLTADTRELMARMLGAFDAAKAELDLGEGLLEALLGRHSEPEGPAPAAGASAFKAPELRAVARALRQLRSRCLAGLRDPAMRELAERVTAQSTAMILWNVLFMLHFSDLARPLATGEEDLRRREVDPE